MKKKETREERALKKIDGMSDEEFLENKDKLYKESLYMQGIGIGGVVIVIVLTMILLTILGGYH